jgi:hypothetical protein
MIFRWLEQRFVAAAERDVMHAQAMVDQFIERHGADPGPPEFVCPRCASTDVTAWNVTFPWSDGWQWTPGQCQGCGNDAERAED